MTEQQPEDERLGTDVPQEGVEFETLDEATATTQWPITMCQVPAFIVEDGGWEMYWRRWLTDQGRRPQGTPTIRLVRFSDVLDPQTGQHMYDADDARESWIIEGPVDAIPIIPGMPPRDVP